MAYAYIIGEGQATDKHIPVLSMINTSMFFSPKASSDHKRLIVHIYAYLCIFQQCESVYVIWFLGQTLAGEFNKPWRSL